MQKFPRGPTDIMTRIEQLEQNQVKIFKMMDSRTKQILEELNEMRMFLRVKLGAPDSSKLKDIMVRRLRDERNNY